MKNVLVIGYGRSSKDFIEYAKSKYNIYLYDDREQDFNSISLSHNVNIRKFDKTVNYNFILTSPGVSPNHKIFKFAYKNNIEIIGEMGYALNHLKGRKIAITGTNGKTTTTSLIYKILEKSFKRVFIAGNIGIPLVSYCKDSRDEDIYVIEVSSFQLETIGKFKPEISIILNLTPDHINWHGSMEEYTNSKFKIWSSAKNNRIYNSDDENLKKQIKKRFKNEQFFTFSINDSKVNSSYIKDNKIYINDNGKVIEIARVDELPIKGRHNLYNALAAVISSYLIGASIESIYFGLTNFKSIEHRYEYLGEYNGVRFINDSKSTNPESTIPALIDTKNPTILIAGGMDKGSSFDYLFKLIKDKISYLVLFGETKYDMQDSAKKYDINTIITNDLDEAFKVSVNKSENGYDILLSPACASWDMYDNFEKRGEHFKTLFRRLKDV